nr:PQQ-binding-like beta-propeller repeat protein [Amycolatopsis albispora]
MLATSSAQEEVAAPVKPPVKARKSPWNRGRDKAIAAGLVVAVLAGAAVVWLTSDSRATVSETAAAAPTLPDAPTEVPGTLTELWRAASPATPVPVAEGTAVVTGNGGEVAGRDPMTGQVRWRYARDLPLCTVAGAWSKAVALYHKDVNCSEVTQLDPGTGKRTALRNGDAELGTQLIDDGSYVTTTGTKLLNTWRDDLVRSMEYGEVPALMNPNKQPRTGCTYSSVAAGSGKVGVVEQCPADPADRLTLMKATPKESDQPEVSYSSVTAGRGVRLVAISGDSTAVALPEQNLLVIYDQDGNQRTAYPLELPPADRGAPQGKVQPVTKSTGGFYWFTGSKTVALSRDNLSPLWTLNGTLGPAVGFAGQLVVPVPGGLAVIEEATGRTIRTIGVDRHGYAGPVRLAALGPVLLEQRGDTLAALR